MFFDRFPRRNYVIDGVEIDTPDLFRRVAPNERIDEALILEKITLRDGQTPWQISYDYYGHVEYYWTILLVNDIINPYHDWLKPAEELRDWALAKYGSLERLNEAHHYIFAGTDIKVDFDHLDGVGGQIVPITNFEHEVEENEKRRNIFLVKKEYIISFARQYESLLRA